MCGKTSSNQQGIVLSSSFTSNGTTPTLTDMVKADYTSAGGDSGGIVYAKNGGYNYYAAGIQSRKANDGSYSVYCKINNINSALGVSLD